MKKFWLLTSLALLVGGVKAQQVINLSDPLMHKFVENYNAGKFAEVYDSLSPNFKSVVTKEQVQGLFSAQAQASGKIERTVATNLSKNRLTYLLDGEKGDFFVQFNLNAGLMDQLFVSGLSNSAAQNLLNAQSLPKSNNLSTSFEKSLDSEIVKFQEHSSLNGLAIGLLDGQNVQFYSYGYASKNLKTVAKENAVFDIGSITKTFTTYLLASLVQEKKISLDATLGSFISNLKPSVSEITVKQLANHTSGLPAMGPNPSVPLLGRDWHEQISTQKLLDHIRTLDVSPASKGKFNYSNLGFGVLGHVLEKATGQSYETLVASYITSALKLKDTFVSKVQSSEITMGQNVFGEDQDYVQLTGYAAAGNIKSSIRDLLTYAGHIMGSSPSAQLVREITFSPEQGNKVALGWIILPVNGRELVFHNGSVIGFNSFLAMDPITKKAIVVLANSNADMTVLGVALSAHFFN